MRKIVASVALAALLTVGVGCGNGNSNGGGGGGGSSVVDLAVGDSRHKSDTDFAVYLWLDVLANLGPGLPAPDITLDTGDRMPTDIKFYNGDLFVGTASGNGSNGGVIIYRDYNGLTDGAVPDVILEDSSGTYANGPTSGHRISLDNNILAVASYYNPNYGIYLWGNADSIADGEAPDVFMNDTNLTGNFTSVRDVQLVNNQLFVSNWSGTDDEPALAIWNDVDALVAGGTAQEPDVTLTDNDNFLDNNNGGREFVVANDILYAADGDQVNIFVFLNASSLTDSSLPDVILEGCVDYNEGCYINSVTMMEVVNDTLWISNKAYNTADFHDPGVVAFYPASALLDNQPPVVRLMGDVFLPSAERLAAAGGALFVSGVPDPTYSYYGSSEFTSGIFVYRNAATLSTGSMPDLSAIGSDDSEITYLETPIAIAATDNGGFDLLLDSGT